MWIQSVFCGPKKHLSEAQSPHRRRNQKPRKVFQVAPTHTVFLGRSKFYSSGLDLSTLEVRSVRRSHSGLSGTGRGSSWK